MSENIINIIKELRINNKLRELSSMKYVCYKGFKWDEFYVKICKIKT